MAVGTQLVAALPTQLGSHRSVLHAPKQEGSAFISPSFKKYNKRNRIQGCFFFLFSLFFFPAAPIIPFVQSKILQFEAVYLFCPSRVYSGASEHRG